MSNGIDSTSGTPSCDLMAFSTVAAVSVRQKIFEKRKAPFPATFNEIVKRSPTPPPTISSHDAPSTNDPANVTPPTAVTMPYYGSVIAKGGTSGGHGSSSRGGIGRGGGAGGAISRGSRVRIGWLSSFLMGMLLARMALA